MINDGNDGKATNAFYKGCDRDSMPEAYQEGFYFDASNMRDENAVSASKGGLVKINGETILFSAPLLIGSWECIYACTVTNHVIECWVEINNAHDPLIRIDGVIMAQSALLGWDKDHPLQGDTNDSCLGGEFYVTDFVQPIFIFNVQDIIDNYNLGSQTYFTLFNPSIYQASLKYALDHPIFVELVNVGAGLDVGKYSYSIRLVDATGNRTNWSVQTPLIPVLDELSTNSNAYYCSDTHGEEPLTSTKYGVKIRFRINNLSNYTYAEIRRVAHNTGQAIGYTPTAQKLAFTTAVDSTNLPYTVDIVANPIGVWDFLDKDGYTWIDITDEEATTIGGSFVCKTLRYYNNRLVPMNIKYPSKDLTDIADDILIDDGALGFPVIENIDKAGHKSVSNQVYYKNHQSGEIESFGIEFYDGFGVRGFVMPYTTPTATTGAYGLDNVRMPNRRDPMTGNSLVYSYQRWKGAVNAADTGNQLARTYERFSLGDGNTLGDHKAGSTAKQITIGNTASNGDPYNPLTPKKMGDTSTNLLNIPINTKVYDGSGNEYAYDPYGFNPLYFSQGFAFNGIDRASLPDWVQGFSIVKRKRAGRIICQGIGVYKMTGGGHKLTDTLTFFSPDLLQQLTPEVAAFIDSPSDYKVQLVSPLGFFSELWTADFKGSSADQNVDLMSYARLVYNSQNINTQLQDASGNNTWYSLFGSWRNGYTNLPPATFPDPFNINTGNADTSRGNTVFNITSCNPCTDGSRYELDTYDLILSGGSSDVYTYNGSGMSGGADINDTNVKNFHEPFYIVNIIDEGAGFINNNINVYEESGHFVKLESIIGKADTTPKLLQLVDERWEDCIPNPFINGVANTSHATVQAENRYCYVDNKRWLNATYKSAGEFATIVSDLNTNGVYVDTDGNECFGIYYNDNITFTSQFFNLRFTSISLLQPQYCIPQQGYITVKYDDGVTLHNSLNPVKVFSGDTFLGEQVFCALDRQNDNNGIDIDTMYFDDPLPYHEFYVNDYIDIMKNASSGVDVFQNRHDLQVGYIRQWAIMFTCESIIDIPCYHNINSIAGASQAGDSGGTYSPNQSFPLINYVQRPQDWDASDYKNNFWNVGGGQIAAAYDLTDFPNEYYNNLWQYGGFKVMSRYNIDYSKTLNDNNNTNMPLVGFTEKTDFCSRIIWSEPRAINQQDSPNLRSYPALNIFDISDAFGEIKYAYDNQSEKGNNLFAICDRGICLLSTEKTIITDNTLSELAIIQPSTGFIKDQYWLSRITGSNDEMWRGIAEYINKCFIPNNESIYLLDGIELTDIGRDCNGSYYSKLYPALSAIDLAYNTPVCAVYDEKHREYWLRLGTKRWRFGAVYTINFVNIGNPNYNAINPGYYVQVYNTSSNSISVVLPFQFATGDSFVIENVGTLNAYLKGSNATQVLFQVGQRKILTRDTSSFGWTISPYDDSLYSKVYAYSDTAKKSWIGTYDYGFDKLLNVRKISGVNDLRVLGMRELTTYKLNDGNTIYGNAINGNVIFPYVGEDVGLTKEAVNISVNSDVKPTRVEFADTVTGLPQCYLDATIHPTLYLKQYNTSWYNQVPRKTATGRNRLQSNVIWTKIIHSTVGNFLLKSVLNGFKKIV